MRTHKRVQWLVTFSILTAFSLRMVMALGMNPLESAMAATITSDPLLSENTTFALVETSSPRRVLDRILERLQVRGSGKELCGLTPEQRTAMLRYFRRVQIHTVNVGGRIVTVAEPQDLLTKSALQAMVGTMYCRSFSDHETILLFLSGSIS